MVHCHMPRSKPFCKYKMIVMILSRLTVVGHMAKKVLSACPIKRRTATNVSYLHVGTVSQY